MGTGRPREWLVVGREVPRMVGHVLVVSGDAEVATMYGHWLEGTMGVRTSCVTTCADAEQALERQGADVVLVDVTRWQQWDECRRLTARHVAPVVALTGWVAADGRFRRRAFESGCAAFVAKPCHPRAIVSILHRVSAGERRLVLM
jgi:CheY-like chemotaxis protein